MVQNLVVNCRFSGKVGPSFLVWCDIPALVYLGITLDLHFAFSIKNFGGHGRNQYRCEDINATISWLLTLKCRGQWHNGAK